jgi:glycosyltransferase involved in cell wall biosynthesis
MRIAQIAPPWISVPPAGYGGTEWVVKHLCDGLVAAGHDVHLFASGDSRTSATLHASFPEQLPHIMKLPGAMSSYEARHVVHAVERIKELGGFDIVHDHSGFQLVAFSRYLDLPPVLHTVHCAFDAHAYPFYAHFHAAVAYATISDYQRSQGPADLNWAGTVYNGLPVEGWPFPAEKDDYLLAFGRVSEAKGFHLAIEIARRAGRRLVMAGVVQEWYRGYFEQRVAPEIDGDRVRFEDEVGDERKRELFAGAAGFLFPILWPEPFGLVMVEAMASGTPVIALRNGSVDEVVADGLTGFVCDDVDQMVDAVDRLDEIDPYVCRQTVERRFSVAAMAAGYEALYERELTATQR